MFRERFFVDLATGQHAQVNLFPQKAKEQGSQSFPHLCDC